MTDITQIPLAPERCPEWIESYRCVAEAGHEGRHVLDLNEGCKHPHMEPQRKIKEIGETEYICEDCGFASWRST